MHAWISMCWLDIPINDLSRSLKRSILVVFGASLYETMKKEPSSLVEKKRGGKILNNYLLILSRELNNKRWSFASSIRDLLLPQMEVTFSPLKRSRIKLPQKRSLGRTWIRIPILESAEKVEPNDVISSWSRLPRPKPWRASTTCSATKKTEGLIGFTKSAAKIVSQPLGSKSCWHQKSWLYIKEIHYLPGPQVI